MPTPTRSAKSQPTRQRSSSLRKPVARKAGWTDLDVRAVDTVRVLAADAVQKVGNGHPGTAMSLAPAAYLLFQKLMRAGATRVIVRRGDPNKARYVAQALGAGKVVVETDTFRRVDVSVILGDDFRPKLPIHP